MIFTLGFLTTAEIKKRAMFLSAALVILLVLIGAWQASRYSENQLRVGAGKTLSAVTNLTHQALITWVNDHEGTAKIWARDTEIVAITEALLALPRQRDTLLTSPLQQQLRQSLASEMEARHYTGYFVIAPDNINLSALMNRSLGITNLLTHQSQLLARARAGETVISLPQIADVSLTDSEGILPEGLPTMYVISPIRNVNNDVIALLAFRIDPSGDLADILAHGIWGETGETFIFDDQARLLSESRHTNRLRERGVLSPEHNSILNITLSPPGQPGELTRLAQTALASRARGGGAVLDSYSDYSGVPVIGAWYWDPELSMGIATEIDEGEALQDLTSLNVTIWTMALLLSAAVVLMFAFHRRSNRHLENERSRFKELADHAYDMISRHNAEGIYRYASPACTRLLGYQPEELVGHSAYEFFHPDHSADIQQLHRHVQTQSTPYVVLYRIRHKDGHYVWFETTSTSLRASNGSVNEIISVSRDVTERKTAEAALIESEARSRALVNNLTEGVVVHDHNGTIVMVNPQAFTILGLTEEQFLGRTAYDSRWHTVKEDGSPFPPVEHPAMVSLHTGQSLSDVVMGVYRPDEVISWISINSRAVESEGRLRYVVVSFRDITQQRRVEQEREKLRDQLQQSQKMQALGQLTGGIAHDFNNILAGIQGYSELLAMMQSDATPESARSYLSQISSATERASSLVQQLLLFSRNKPGKPESTDPAVIVNEVVSMLQPTFPAAIRFIVEIDRDLPQLMIDPTQLHQVITNLCINARDSMEGRGELRIAVTTQTLEDGTCASCRQPTNGEWLALDVGDTGHGIDAEIMSRIFDPFFTTKEVGKGSGMGLAMVHGIIHEHGGHILTISTVGHGTVFRLLLPIRGEEKQTSDKQSTPEEHAAI